MREPLAPESETIHAFKNQLAIIIGFAELLLDDLAEEDPRRKDIEEICKAGYAALALVPKMAEDPPKS